MIFCKNMISMAGCLLSGAVAVISDDTAMRDPIPEGEQGADSLRMEKPHLPNIIGQIATKARAGIGQVKVATKAQAGIGHVVGGLSAPAIATIAGVGAGVVGLGAGFGGGYAVGKNSVVTIQFIQEHHR